VTIERKWVDVAILDIMFPGRFAWSPRNVVPMEVKEISHTTEILRLGTYAYFIGVVNKDTVYAMTYLLHGGSNREEIFSDFRKKHQINSYGPSHRPWRWRED
jgi:hypothetical protein